MTTPGLSYHSRTHLALSEAGTPQTPTRVFERIKGQIGYGHTHDAIRYLIRIGMIRIVNPLPALPDEREYARTPAGTACLAYLERVEAAAVRMRQEVPGPPKRDLGYRSRTHLLLLTACGEYRPSRDLAVDADYLDASNASYSYGLLTRHGLLERDPFASRYRLTWAGEAYLEYMEEKHQAAVAYQAAVG